MANMGSRPSWPEPEPEHEAGQHDGQATIFPQSSRWEHHQFYNMPDGSQRSSRTSRSERSTTSCGECRRRKQKCDQRQPCSNCARRFPQPTCEYRPNKRTTQSVSPPSLPTFSVTLRPDQFSDQPIPGTYDALLEAPQPPWAKRRGGEVVRWSGVDITTTYPSTSSSGSSIWSSSWRDQQGGLPPGSVPLCGKDCKEHSDAIHDALKLLMHHYSIPDRFLGDNDGIWNPANIDDFLEWNAQSAAGIPWPVGGPADELRHLPMAATRQNGELLRICQQHSHAPFPILSVADLLRIDLKLLCRFKGSLDGNPDAGNPFIKHYVPYCIQDPLLLQIILYTSTCFLNETGHVPHTLVMAHKGRAIHMLNEYLRSDTSSQTSDSAIAGVIQLIVDEWYWGETQDLRAHLRGLREMIRLRGGFSQLGMNGFLAKNAIAHDVSIALAHEVKPFLQNGHEFNFEDSSTVPFRIAHNSPLVANLPPFADCISSLGLHPATATILDDMRFLFNAVASLPATPSPQQLQKVKTTSEWMHNRLLNLSPISGGAPPPGAMRCSNPSSAPSRDSTSSPGSVSATTSTAGSPGGMGGEVSSGTASGLDEPSAKHRSPGDSSDTTRGGRASSSGSFQRGRGRGGGGGGGGTQSREGRLSAEDSHLHPQARYAEKPDWLYQAVRLAALVYCRAIMNQAPVSETCTSSDFLAIWTTTWRVPLTTWKATVGVFNWIILSISPSCHGTAHARFVKSMLMISVLSLGLENWQVAMNAARAALQLQSWLGQGREEEGDGLQQQQQQQQSGEGSTVASGGMGKGIMSGSGRDGDAERESVEGQSPVGIREEEETFRGAPSQSQTKGKEKEKGVGKGKGVSGGRKAVEKHGYHQPEW